ncbi:hypothetical protein SAMN05421788_1011148 [Filimonas lacunae]|uniref:Uncharacterized protein n=1 Tax=Filimonas lacunae TaxID=477680 RepID=A0A173MPW2_9BACT|nr:hypothetical protein [Filimonas lacunae]BAV09713.1 hypothetical protein FLA_5766 [Filimonas lacunae]SIS77704.1 hypothetical protein SAMN05421788_1011148 [Filimonas lacunae]
MKSTSYIQPIIRMLLPPELHAFTDIQVWKAIGLHMISRIKDTLQADSL